MLLMALYFIPETIVLTFPVSPPHLLTAALQEIQALTEDEYILLLLICSIKCLLFLKMAHNQFRGK